MLFFLGVVVFFLIMVIMFPFLAFGWWTSTTPTGADVYNGINWVLNNWFQLLGGGLVWLLAVFCLCLYPYIMGFTTMKERDFDGTPKGTLITLLISAVPSVLFALLGRWALPYVWPRRIILFVLIASLIIQGLRALSGMLKISANR